jgi:cell division transport system permease protein
MYALKEAIKAMIQSRSMTLVSIGTITVALFLLGVFAALTIYANGFLNSVMQAEEMHVYVSDEMDNADLDALARTVRSMAEVADARVMTKEDAREELKNLLDEDLLVGLEENPLPRSVVITMKSGMNLAKDLEAVASRARNVEGVEDVQYAQDWISRLDMIFLGFVLVEAIFIFLIIGASLFIISNTISMTVIARRGMINIMRLVGATDSFIKRPFYYEGIMQGLAAGIIAFLLLIGIYLWLTHLVPAMETFQFMLKIHETEIPPIVAVLAAIIPAGAVLGFLGSTTAVGREIE